MNRNSTLKATLLDRLHAQEQGRATRYILAGASTAPLSGPALTVREVRETFTFTPYEAGTLIDPAAGIIQAAMLVHNPADPADRFIVTANFATGEWTAECPRGRHEFAAVVICAVQERIAANASRKAVN